MGLEHVTDSELKNSGYNIRGQVGMAYKFQNGSSFLYAEPVTKNTYDIKAWYFENEKTFSRNGTAGIQLDMFARNYK